jgi:hypothetical protein
MALVVPNDGEVDALSYYVNKSAPQDLVLRLFTNNITPAETDVAATYTEAAGGGYASITLTGASWTVTGGAPSDASYAQQTFTFTGVLTGNASVYGYYLTRVTSGKIAHAERFSDGPYAIANNGDAIKVTPKITGD